MYIYIYIYICICIYIYIYMYIYMYANAYVCVYVRIIKDVDELRAELRAQRTHTDSYRTKGRQIQQVYMYKYMYEYIYICMRRTATVLREDKYNRYGLCIRTCMNIYIYMYETDSYRTTGIDNIHTYICIYAYEYMHLYIYIYVYNRYRQYTYI
jgi:hypothetical protein